MNVIDYFIIGSLLISGILAFRKSFIAELAEFVIFLLSFLISLRFYDLIANYLQKITPLSFLLANILSFLLIWFISELTLYLVVNLIGLRVKIILILDRNLKNFTFIPAALKNAVLLWVLMVVFISFPIFPGFKNLMNNSVIGAKVISLSQPLEEELKKIFPLGLENRINFISIQPRTDETIQLGFSTTQFTPREDLENQMIDLVNEERISRGLGALALNQKLKNIARFHSQDMFTRGYFSHYSSQKMTVADRAENVSYKYLVLGENLAYAPELHAAHKGLMNSSGHRENILLFDYQQIGIGIMDGGVYGLMITQVFSD